MLNHRQLVRTLEKVHPGKQWTLDDLSDERRNLLALVLGYDTDYRASRNMPARAWGLEDLRTSQEDINTILSALRQPQITPQHFAELYVGHRLTWHHEGETPPTIAELEAQYNTVKSTIESEDAKALAARAFFQKYDRLALLRAIKGNAALLQQMRADIAAAGL